MGTVSTLYVDQYDQATFKSLLFATQVTVYIILGRNLSETNPACNFQLKSAKLNAKN